MAYFSEYFGEEDLKAIWKSIERKLKARGYKPIDKDQWEKHGPHPGMDFMVFIGRAEDLKTKQELEVVLYPHRVYHMGNVNTWSDVKVEDALPLRRKSTP